LDACELPYFSSAQLSQDRDWAVAVDSFRLCDRGRPIAEGNVGGGTGTIYHELKGGT
jgi:L-aminopeptidase/D-esterase-like protein